MKISFMKGKLSGLFLELFWHLVFSGLKLEIIHRPRRCILGWNILASFKKYIMCVQTFSSEVAGVFRDTLEYKMEAIFNISLFKHGKTSLYKFYTNNCSA